MLDEKQTRDAAKVLRYLIPIALLHGILHLCGYRIRDRGDPAFIWIIFIVHIGNLLYNWKDKRALLKRCIFASLFASLMAGILVPTTIRPNSFWFIGNFIFIVLTWEEDSSKQSFIVTLVTVTILVTLLGFWGISLKSMRTPPQTDSIEKPMSSEIAMWCSIIIAGCIMVVWCFYGYYHNQLSRTQKTPQWRPLLVKSIKRAGALFLPVLVFFISQMVCEHYDASLTISLMVSSLIPLCFIVVWYKLGWFSDKNSTENESKESGHEGLLDNSKKKVSSKKSRAGICDCCGKDEIPQEMLFKIDSGQQLCAACLKEMDNIHG